MRHTPGPWTVAHTEDGHRIQHPKLGYIADIYGGRVDEIALNAALISAAPELLEILEEIVTALDDEFLEDATRLGLDATIIEARTVLAKARGET